MIQLSDLSQGEFDAYLAELAHRYAQSIEASWKVDTDTAVFFAQHQLKTLLPMGLNTPFHCLRKIELDHRSVGMVWFSNQNGSAAYLYDIVIDEKNRRKGIGTEVMKMIEEEVRSEGCIALSLHVFQHNPNAQRLYEKLGLSVIGVQMYKAFN